MRIMQVRGTEVQETCELIGETYRAANTVALKVSPQGHVSGRSPQSSGSSLR